MAGICFLLHISILVLHLIQGVSSADNIKNGEPLVLLVDEALINITAVGLDPNDSLVVKGISQDCYMCPIQDIATFSDSMFFKVSTKYPFSVTVNDENKTDPFCRFMNFPFGERGHYLISVQKQNGKFKCDDEIQVIKEPEFTNLALIVAFVIIVVASLLWVLIQRYYNMRMHSANLAEDDSPIKTEDEDVPLRDMPSRYTTANTSPTVATEDPNSKPAPDKKKRLRSLDTFRGISLTIMIFVNYGGGWYWYFGHASWNGLTVADLVFPWFIWIMGVSMILSFRSLKRRNVPRLHVVKKIVKRSLILFCLGLFLNYGYEIEKWRIPGVLQRFGITYLVIALMQLFLTSKLTEENLPAPWMKHLIDVIEIWPQWVFMTFLVLLFLILTYLVPIPGCPTGYVGPGGIGQGYPEAFNCTGGMAGYIDRWILTEKHIYGRPTSKTLYLGVQSFDPEGILGSLNSIFLTFLGVQAGKIMFSYTEHRARIVRWLIWATILGVIAIGLSGGRQNDGPIPINKNLWSVSFVLANGSLAFFLLTVCYFLNDVKGWWNGAPFFYPGMNSIFVYCGSYLVYSYFPFQWKIHGNGSHAEKLGMDLCGTCLWLLISYFCFTIKFFVKI